MVMTVPVMMKIKLINAHRIENRVLHILSLSVVNSYPQLIKIFVWEWFMISLNLCGLLEAYNQNIYPYSLFVRPFILVSLSCSLFSSLSLSRSNLPIYPSSISCRDGRDFTHIFSNAATTDCCWRFYIGRAEDQRGKQ